MISKYVTSAYEITDSYKEILIIAKNAKVKIEPSNDEKTKLAIFEKKRMPYEFSIQDGKLTIKPKKAKWYDFLRIGIDRAEIKLYVPESRLENIMIIANVGEVDIYSIFCNGAINIQTNTGKVNLQNVSCKTFVTKGNTGSVSLSEFFAEETISINRNTGKV